MSDKSLEMTVGRLCGEVKVLSRSLDRVAARLPVVDRRQIWFLGAAATFGALIGSSGPPWIAKLFAVTQAVAAGVAP